MDNCFKRVKVESKIEIIYKILSDFSYLKPKSRVLF